MLTQQELLDKLSELGMPMTTQTLRNREKQGLVTPAYRGGSGRAGRSVFYPIRCLWEHYAAGRLLNSQRLRLTATEVKTARDLAMPLEDGSNFDWKGLRDRPDYELLDLRLAEYWHAHFLHAKNGAPAEWAIIVSFVMEEYNDMTILHSYQAVTRDMKTGKIQCGRGFNLCIEVADGRTWIRGEENIDTNSENLVYIEV